jgi:coproporphyrinogen III oxidase-like Fe-S oxidoreductase
MFGFRLYAGIDPTDFAVRHGRAAEDLLPFWLNTLQQLATQKLVTCRGLRWALTPYGRSFADSVAEALLPPN